MQGRVFFKINSPGLNRLALWLPPFFVFIALALRQGFSQSYLQELITLSGVSYFLLLLPGFVNKNTRGNWLFFESSLSVAALVVICFLGYYCKHVSWLIAMVALCGHVLLVGNIFLHFRMPRFSMDQTVLFIALLIILIWTVGAVWGGLHLRPTFIETLVVSKPYFGERWFESIDTLFNASITQMLRNYHVPSLGLDGLPPMHYHYGSHWLMAGLSNFTGIHPILVYNLGYPIIFLPLFFHVFIGLCLRLQEFWLQEKESGLIFFLILLCVFVQVPRNIYTGGLLGISAFVNDSFTTSLIGLFLVFHIWLNYGQEQGNWWAFTLINALLIFGISMVKISSGFILATLTFYFFFRLNLYKKVTWWLGAVVVAMSFLIAFWITSESIPGVRQLEGSEGAFSFFHFYRRTHDFKIWDWVIGFYFWFYLSIALVFWWLKKTNTAFKAAWQEKRNLLGVEAALVCVVAGTLPSFFIVFNGGNSMYFSGIQVFVAGAVVLGFLPFVRQIFLDLLQKRRIVIRISSIILISVILLLGASEAKDKVFQMAEINILTRKEILRIPVNVNERFNLLKDENYSMLSKRMSDHIDTLKLFKFVTNLTQLNHSARTALFLNMQQLPVGFYGNINCINTNFIPPAFSGSAFIDGLSYKCNIGVFGESYYQRHFEGHPNPSEEELCKIAQQKGFDKVLIISPELDSRWVDCKK